jgi:hypothetical protein
MKRMLDKISSEAEATRADLTLADEHEQTVGALRRPAGRLLREQGSHNVVPVRRNRIGRSPGDRMRASQGACTWRDIPLIILHGFSWRMASPPSWILEYLRELARWIVDQDKLEEDRGNITFIQVFGSVWPRNIGGRIDHKLELGREIDHELGFRRALIVSRRLRSYLIAEKQRRARSSVILYPYLRIVPASMAAWNKWKVNGVVIVPHRDRDPTSWGVEGLRPGHGYCLVSNAQWMESRLATLNTRHWQ